mgnify:FL=1
MTRTQFNRLMISENSRLNRLERSWSKKVRKAIREQVEHHIEHGVINNALYDALAEITEVVILDYAERQTKWLKQGVIEKTDRFFIRWSQRVTEYLTTTLFKKVQEIDRTTIELIREKTHPLITAGATISDIQQSIRQATSEVYSLARSRIIARTELMDAVAQGKKESSDLWEQETGMKQGKLWIHRGAKEPRSWHQHLDNGIAIPKHEPFQVYQPSTGGTEPMMYPHDPNASAENVINCSCTCIYTLLED